MERVREVGAETTGLGEDGVERARHALMREIDRAGRPGAATVRTHRGRWIGGSALVGGLAAAALVVGVVVVPAGAPSAQAAEVLERAAAATLTTTVLTPGPGQYIRIQEIQHYRFGWTPDADAPGGGFWDSRPAATEASLLDFRALYVPADRSGEWVRDYNEGWKLIEATGPELDDALPALEDQYAPSDRDIEFYPGGMYTQTGVGAEGVELDDVLSFTVSGLQCYEAEMPRDPEALAAWLENYEHEYLSACHPPEITEPVDFNLAPPDLRAAMYRAMALIEGARVVRSDGDVTTIAIPEGGESTHLETVDIDTTTGLMVGRGHHDGEDRWSSDVVVSIVDSLPEKILAARE